MLANAARDLIAKIAAALPEELRPILSEPTTGTGHPGVKVIDGIDIAHTRRWIREGRKIRLSYRDESGAASERVIWPVVIGYFNDRRTLAAWCELRQDFRHFRADRVAGATFLDDRHGERTATLRQRWMRTIRKNASDA